MPCQTLQPEQLRLHIDPATLPFAETGELLNLPVPWIGQRRAEEAARFGLSMDQPDYHLFVLGEVGSGRLSLLSRLAREVAATRPVPPDLCYLHNFESSERPRALRMPPGQGRELRQLMQQLCRTLEQEIPQRLNGDDFKAESERIESSYKSEESHDQPAQRLREGIALGDRLISTQGARVGQVNGLTQVDLGDWRFGLPVRVSARSHAGQDGVVAIEREVAMSGPIHDKGVLILQGLLGALFAHVAPLALNASIVFEQEYQGIEGDSASCAELLALLSSLAETPLLQGIAVTGALNQHGEIMPVGGINEKIEGWFEVCEAAGLDGTHGVLIPARNLRHLMLDRRVVDAVGQGLFRVYVAHELGEALTLLSSQPAGWSAQQSRGGPFEADTVLGRVQQNLRGFRRACRRATRR